MATPARVLTRGQSYIRMAERDGVKSMLAQPSCAPLFRLENTRKA
jgi:hypothetical protein